MAKKLRFAVDGVVFQYGSNEQRELWERLLAALATIDDFELILIDRGHSPLTSGMDVVPFNSYHFRYTPADSILLQKVCDHLNVDLFISTFYTTPLATPAIGMIYPSAPEVLHRSRLERFRQERNLCLSFCRWIFCWKSVDFDEGLDADAERVICPDLEDLPLSFADKMTHLCWRIPEVSFKIVKQHKSGQFDRFFQEWSELRNIQQNVDIDRMF